MPWVVEKDVGTCSLAKPFAVKTQAKPGGKGGALVAGGCHATKADALRHQRALYANAPDANADELAAIDLEIRSAERAEQRKSLRGVVRGLMP